MSYLFQHETKEELKAALKKNNSEEIFEKNNYSIDKIMNLTHTSHLHY